MQERTQIGKTLILVAATVVAVAALVIAGCTAGNSLASGTGTTINAATTSVPVSITDAPGDQVLAATLTLNSVVLKDASGGTASLLSAPVTFEAAHLDAVQEPLFTPAIPQAAYTSVTITYSNPVVAYVDSTGNAVVASATLANTSQTITFPTAITVSNAKTTMLIDYLVAQSVAINGSTVTVTPTFHISAAPIHAQPINGIEGLHSGVKGKITALGTNQFTLVNPAGISVSVTVNNNTQYEENGLTAFSGLAVGMFVEVDLQLQTDGSLLALRVEQEEAPTVPAMLVGPVTSVTGTPATSFTEVVRQQVGSSTTAPVASDTITVNSSTKFVLPGRLHDIQKGGLPFTPAFDASSIFPGQVVAVATSGVTGNAATALGVMLSPQTISGNVTTAPTSACTSCWSTYTITMPSTSWVAILTGKTTVSVLVPPMGIQMLSTAPAVGSTVRFNGFLFKNNGNLTMIGLIGGPGPGTPFDQH